MNKSDSAPLLPKVIPVTLADSDIEKYQDAD